MVAAYTPTIGLEIHAELKTRTKMFCDSRNDPDATQVNEHTCPVCLAHPGTLPTINKQAVEHVLRVGTALNATLANYTEFDRKSYFYPDIPKGYQISQYEHPLVAGGELAGVAITRVHLEEDTARSSHAGPFYVSQELGTEPSSGRGLGSKFLRHIERTSMRRTRRVLFKMHSCNSDACKFAPSNKRVFVLANLISLRDVWIEVGLTVELGIVR